MTNMELDAIESDAKSPEADALHPMARRTILRLVARVRELHAIFPLADEAIRWMTHVGTITLDPVGDFKDNECQSIECGPGTCNCGSEATRFAYTRARDAARVPRGDQ